MKITIDVVQKKHHLPEKTLQAHMESVFFLLIYSLFLWILWKKNLLDHWYTEKKR